ncbi:MAG: hypothetical protein ACP5K7_11500 [Verrucomicrobiia bacterium]
MFFNDRERRIRGRLVGVPRRFAGWKNAFLGIIIGNLSKRFCYDGVFF